MHLNAQLSFERFAVPYFSQHQRILEIGPEASPSAYRSALDHLELTWETADLAPELMPAGSPFRPAVSCTHTMPSEYEIPVADDSFDIVVAGQVIYTVRRVWVWMKELARVTKPGGKIIIVSPISWPYCAAPIDCWRIYPEGMRCLCAEADLEVLICEQTALEPKVSRRQYYGESSPDSQRMGLSKMREMVKVALGWPMPTALDMVTVARKPIPRS